MNNFFKLFLWGFLVSVCAFACKSNSYSLKDATYKIKELTEAMSTTKYEVEFDRLVAEYNNFMTNFPKSLQEMPEEQLANLDGGSDYLEAMEIFNQVYVAKSRFFAFADYDEPESQNEPVVTHEDQEMDDIFNEILNSRDNLNNYILTPGVTYITTSSGSGTDELGGRVNLSMEFTIYNDGTVMGNLIETNSENSYGNTNSYDRPLEGTWTELSQHDKRFLRIDLVLDAEGYYNEFTYYIDENLNAYANNISSRPVKLRKKEF